MNPEKEKSLEGDDNDDEDRISRLSNDILCHILSFVPTINSVTTCVLSKRWKHPWEYVPKLSFDDSIVHSYNLLHLPHYVSFANIVNRALSHHTKLSELSLRCRQINDLYDITKWLSNSIMRNIQSLDLKIYHGYSRSKFELPSCIFTCKTLESLMLEGNILLNVPSHVCLPKLRILQLVRLVYQEHHDASLISSSSSLESLVIEDTSGEGHLIIGSNPQMSSSTLRHMKLINSFSCNEIVMVPSNVFTFQTLEKLILERCFFISDLPTTISMPNLTLLELVDVQYQDDQIFSRLISSCTSLESLNVRNSMEVAELNISSCTLKFIKIKLITHPNNRGHKLVINAPALKYLKLNVLDEGMLDYQIEDLPSLKQAVVIIDFDRDISHSYCSSSLMNIYKALQHVKSLTAEHSFLKGCGFGHALPMFTRLTELDLNIHSHKCGLLLEFIINSTKLKNLRLNGLCGVSWRNPNKVPACLLTSLRTVLITSFRGGTGATRMVKYFIENARILEKMEVCFGPYYCCDMKVCKEILNFRLASKKCLVLIK